MKDSKNINPIFAVGANASIRFLFRVVALFMVVSGAISHAQTPNDDPNHYILDTYDNFNSFNSNMWNRVPNNTWGQEIYNINNVIVSGGKLTLKCEKNGNSYVSGGIETVHKK